MIFSGAFFLWRCAATSVSWEKAQNEKWLVNLTSLAPSPGSNRFLGRRTWDRFALCPWRKGRVSRHDCHLGTQGLPQCLPKLPEAFDYVNMLYNKTGFLRFRQWKHSFSVWTGARPLHLLSLLCLLPGHWRSNESFSCPTLLTSCLLGKL